MEVSDVIFLLCSSLFSLHHRVKVMLRSMERVSAEHITLEVVTTCARKRGKNAVKEWEKVV